MTEEKEDDLLTLSAIAVLAFILTDIAHEVVGHGIGFLLAGGRACILTTTRLNDTQRLGDHGGDLFDLGGPFGNLMCAALAWVARPVAPHLHRLLWLTAAFSLFWAFAYLMFCGVFGHGDWFALIRAVPRQWVWRIVFVALGFWLYRLSMKILASEIRWITLRSVSISYIAAGFIACAAAIPDPRGAYALLHDAALSSLGAAIGLLYIPRQLLKPPGDPQQPIYSSVIWLIAAAVLSCFYIFVLGPGITIAL